MPFREVTKGSDLMKATQGNRTPRSVWELCAAHLVACKWRCDS